MANQDIKLQKTIISNNNSNTLYNKEFNKLAKSDVEIDQSRILDIYDIVFYNTPKTGTYSHTSIVQRIYDYVYTSLNRDLDNQIEQLSDNLITKNEELDDKQSPFETQHPVYANGSFIIAGENGIQYPGLPTVYVMQEGLKRPIASLEMYQTIRKCFDQPYTGSGTFSGLYYVPINELNSIDDGVEIATTEDLSIIGTNLNANDVDVQATYSNYLLKVVCKGMEIEDAADQLISDPDADFYYDGACILEYYDVGLGNFDVYPYPSNIYESAAARDVYASLGDNDQPRRTTANPISKRRMVIPARTMVTIRVGRNNDLQTAIDGVPNNAAYDIVNVQHNGNTVQDYIREWGEGTKYDGITEAQGKMYYQEIGKDLQIYNELSNPKVLNGLPSNYTVVGQPVGEELSTYGTRMIYPGTSGLYGAQFHEDNLQKEVFNNPSSEYYHPAIYGQPIFRYDNDYLVLLGHNFTNNQVVFISLEKQPGEKGASNSGYPGSPIFDYYTSQFENPTAAANYYSINSETNKFHIVSYKENKLAKQDDNDKHICPLADPDDKHKLGWKRRSDGGGHDWNLKRLRYKGFRNVGTFGYNTTSQFSQAEMGVPNPGGINALQEGFIIPSYMFDHPTHPWTPWE